MISVAELVGTHGEAVGPGFGTRELSQDATKSQKGNGFISSHHLEALRLLLKLGSGGFFLLANNLSTKTWSLVDAGRFFKGALSFL